MDAFEVIADPTRRRLIELLAVRGLFGRRVGVALQGFVFGDLAASPDPERTRIWLRQGGRGGARFIDSRRTG